MPFSITHKHDNWLSNKASADREDRMHPTEQSGIDPYIVLMQFMQIKARHGTYMAGRRPYAPVFDTVQAAASGRISMFAPVVLPAGVKISACLPNRYLA